MDGGCETDSDGDGQHNGYELGAPVSPSEVVTQQNLALTGQRSASTQVVGFDWLYLKDSRESPAPTIDRDTCTSQRVQCHFRGVIFFAVFLGYSLRIQEKEFCHLQEWVFREDVFQKNATVFDCFVVYSHAGTREGSQGTPRCS